MQRVDSGSHGPILNLRQMRSADLSKITAEKAAVSRKLEEVSPFTLSKSEGHGASGRTSSTAASDSTRLKEINQALSESKPLDDLLADRKAMETVRSVYGANLYSQLIKEGAGIMSAKSKEEARGQQSQGGREPTRPPPSHGTLRQAGDFDPDGRQWLRTTRSSGLRTRNRLIRWSRASQWNRL